MEKYYLAVDIGASSGRHILGSLKDGKLNLEEIYRFPNGMKDVDGSVCWDVEALFCEIKEGLKRCKEAGKIPSYMGIDTWAVDYVLLDGKDQVLGKTYGYRDSRTTGMDEKVYEIISREELYGRTGIQKQIFNTIYQLMAVKQKEPELFDKAESLLFIPDYFHFLLTGVKKTEYTNATTSQLVSPRTKDWDYELIDRLEYSRKIFGKISKPGTYVGNFREEIRREVGFDCQVILPATHDTGSAVAAIPTTKDNALYISSGTWSLMGTELMAADCTLESMKRNLTNEGGYDYRFRYLKNIMGLWMIQSVRREFKEEYSYDYICRQASEQTIPSIVDCNDNCFLAPKSMIEEVKDYCQKSGQQVPENEWETAAVIYNSLGRCYAETIGQIEQMTGQKYDRIYVVGGGSNAEYLNRITAKYTGRAVYAGPGEATAIGNLLVQMLYNQEFVNLKMARACVKDSFEIRKYEKT
ncbi:rhamnulokinase [Parablautia intestinalis]|uniref:Rhamnulokinase n=1 Tax=Parablautia intestinalis TaxID=2320100 RepID=A0A3A9B3K2_9FIRM|nr:rhamnulokinase [Parablautia intestinalis]RKI93315.1 rhamnulokinase [Parablautia intestinalis]